MSKSDVLAGACVQECNDVSDRAFYFTLTLLVLLDVAHRVLSMSAGPSPLEKDALGYWLLGQQFAEGDWFLFNDASAFRTPLYPAYIGLFQALFDEWALTAAIVGQHVMGIFTSLIVGAMCRMVTDSRLAYLSGFVVSMLCLARLQYANFILSETLFIFLLTAHLYFVLRWLFAMTWTDAAWAGLVLGLAILVRPVAQLLWIPEVLVILLPISSKISPPWRVRLFQSACFMFTLLVTITPWLARNHVVFGEPFLTKSLGRNIWIACYSPHAANLRLPEALRGNAEDPSRYRDTWYTYNRLRNQNMNEPQSDDWMRKTCIQSISQQPVQYLIRSTSNSFYFWWHVKGMMPWYHRYHEMSNYGDQATWYSQRIARRVDPVFTFFYRYHPLWSGGFAFLAFAGAGLLSRQRPTRKLGLGLILILLYFAVVTSLFEEPIYRYRVVVEPVMILSMIAGFWTFVLRNCKSTPALVDKS